MDETTVRTLLEQLAAEPAPPSGVDIADARGRGRRRLRWRRAGLAAAPLAAAAAAALIVTGTVPFGPRGGSGNAPVAPRPAATARPSMAALTPHASFGWLPAGFSLRTGPGTGSWDAWTPGGLTMYAWSPATRRVLILQVTALRNCHLTPNPSPDVHARFELVCARGGSLGPVTAAAAAVQGGRAYWTYAGGLEWQTQLGTWAQLHPATQISGPGLPRAVERGLAGWQSAAPTKGHPGTVQSAATRALLRTVAAHVSYGGATAILFPFRLTGLPADWRAHVARFTPAGGRLLGTSLLLGPASNLGALNIAATFPAGTLRSACGNFMSGQPENLTIDGAQGFLRTIDQPGKHEQDLCLHGYHGWSLKLYLRPTVSGSGKRLPGAPRGVLAVLHHLRLLGPYPASWTAAPLG